MSQTDDQARPLAPEVHRLHIPYQPPHSDEFPPTRRSCAIKCCGFSTALLLIAAMVVLVLMFTVFRIKDPVLSMNSVTLQGQGLRINGTAGPRNITLEADVEIKNPNVASFRFSNTTSHVYCCGGALVGEGWAPAGEAGARRTVGLKMRIDVRVGGWTGGIVAISSRTRMTGRVKISSVVKRGVDVRLECVMNVNATSLGIQDLDCTTKFG